MVKVMKIINKIGFIGLAAFAGWSFDNHYMFTGISISCVLVIEVMDRFFQKNS
jgi:hypothetical protein